MHKLNLNFTEYDKPKEQKIIEKVNHWATPVGWWTVDTEGDCEGRTSTQLGSHYGHVAEIAFSLANRCYYSLSFRPTMVNVPSPLPLPRPMYIATGRKVNVSFNDGPFFLSSIKGQINDFQLWLNAEGVKVTDCCYYGAVTLTI